MPRPRKPSVPGVEAPPNLTFRASPELRDKLMTAAGGETIGAEIRRRLEASFEPAQHPVGDAQTMNLVNAILAAADVLSRSGEPRQSAAASAILAGLSTEPAPWHADPTSFKAFEAVILHLLAERQPAGEADADAARRRADRALGAAMYAARPERPWSLIAAAAARRKLRRPE